MSFVAFNVNVPHQARGDHRRLREPISGHGLRRLQCVAQHGAAPAAAAEAAGGGSEDLVSRRRAAKHNGGVWWWAIFLEYPPWTSPQNHSMKSYESLKIIHHFNSLSLNRGLGLMSFCLVIGFTWPKQTFVEDESRMVTSWVMKEPGGFWWAMKKSRKNGSIQERWGWRLIQARVLGCWLFHPSHLRKEQHHFGIFRCGWGWVCIFGMNTWKIK